MSTGIWLVQHIFCPLIMQGLQGYSGIQTLVLLKTIICVYYVCIPVKSITSSVHPSVGITRITTDERIFTKLDTFSISLKLQRTFTVLKIWQEFRNCVWRPTCICASIEHRAPHTHTHTYETRVLFSTHFPLSLTISELINVRERTRQNCILRSNFVHRFCGRARAYKIQLYSTY